MAPPRSVATAAPARPGLAGLRRRGPVVAGLLAGCAALVAPVTLRDFLVPAYGAVGQAPVAPMVAASAALRLEEARGDVTPRTQMHGRYPDRSRNNAARGGRYPIRVNRKPVLAYSVNDEEGKEPGGSVLRRMWEMYDMNYEKMVAERARFYYSHLQKPKWTNSYWMRLGRRRKERRERKEVEDAWLQWMRTTGRTQGLAEPIIYNGPLVKMTPEEEEVFTPATNINPFKNVDTPIGKLGYKKAWGEMEDMKPGRWNHDGTAELMFKIWRRPLHKHPFDIGRKGRSNKVIHGNVM